MYRKLILLLVCATTIRSAPQQDSNITHIKQIGIEYPQPEVTAPVRESRIEKLPLTIPGNVSKEPIDNTDKDTENVDKTPVNDKQPNYNYSDRIYSIKIKPKNNNNGTEKIKENVEEFEQKKSDFISETKDSDNISATIDSDNISDTKDSDIAPAESILTDRLAPNEDKELSSESDPTQSDEFVTEKYEEFPVTTVSEVSEETTKAPKPKFLPKLSYFGKSAALASFSQNLIASPGKRRFKSKCRCEKIWNCAKLQITVPRCPDEYFLCCS